MYVEVKMERVLIIVFSSIVLGYLLGCISVSYILSAIKGFDIRKYGSGNAGASNVMIVIGRKAGFAVALLDIFKAYIAVKLACWIFPDAVMGQGNYAGCIAGAFAIIGHILPFYMKFRGGKGLATLGGTILAVDYKLFFILLFLAIVIAVVSDYICFVPISMALIFPITYGYLVKSWGCTFILLFSSLFIWYKHAENIQRIKRGEELKFHFLWNRESESERLGIADDGEEIFKREKF